MTVSKDSEFTLSINIVRSHMVVQDGFEMMVGRKLLTVFSTRSFMGTVNNSAAVICLNSKMELFYQQLLPDPSSTCYGICSQPTTDMDPSIDKRDKESIRMFLKW